MIILNLATTLDGGAGTGLWRYHQALVAAGIDSRILVMSTPAAADPRVSPVRWRRRALPLRILRRLGLWRSRREALLRDIARLDQRSPEGGYELFTLPYSDYCPEDHPWIAEADLINIHWVAGLLDWPRFFRRVHLPIVITLHDQQPYLGGFHYARDAENNPRFSALETRLREVKRRALSGHRVGVVANSRWNAAEARASGFFTPSAPVETVYYPLDTTVFSPREKPPAKTAAGIPSERLVVGFACENLDNARKGFADLIGSLDELPAALRSRITLLSFGRDPSPDLVARVNLPWVHLGYLTTDEVKVAAYAAMDVFVAPSHAEAFGLTALEASAVGVPVIAYRVGGLAEAVPSAVPRSPAALAEQIVALLSDESLRRKRALDGRHLAVERHDPAVIGVQLAAFCRALAG